MNQDNQLLLIGKISKTHGIKGNVKIISYSDSVKNFIKYQKYYFADHSPLQIKFITTQENYILANINNITDRTAAETLRGKEIFILRKELDQNNIAEDEFYNVDLLDMKIYNQEAQYIGNIAAVNNYGAGDIIEINFTNGKIESFPFTKEVFPTIDKENNKVTFVEPEIFWHSPDHNKQ